MKCAHLISFLLFTYGISQPVFAHGVKIDYQQTSAITIRATFEDGTPMANAQTVIYSPKDAINPWLKGVTDKSGKFTFVPEAGVLGNWDVKVRQSGHGKIISIPLETSSAKAQNLKNEKDLAGENLGKQEPKIESSLTVAGKTEALQRDSEANSFGNSNYSWQQKMIMSVSIIWGFLGTALFLSRKQT